VYHMSIDWFGLLLYFHFVFDNFWWNKLALFRKKQFYDTYWYLLK
jgi:hypothetical protein